MEYIQVKIEEVPAWSEFDFEFIVYTERANFLWFLFILAEKCLQKFLMFLKFIVSETK